MKRPSRLFTFIKKEFLQLKRDPRMLWVAIFAPLIQLLIFGYIASLDVKHISTAVYDEDHTYYSRTYLESFRNSGYFDLNYYAANQDELKTLLDAGKVKLALHFPPGFGKKILKREPATVQALLDGENSSLATIVKGYLDQINTQNALKFLPQNLSFNPLEVQVRLLYNPQLKSVYFMVPAIFALVLMIESMLLTSFSIVKEKEKGTIEQLMVTPLGAYELILGKLIPFSLVAMLDIFLVFLVATLWFRVPLHGNVFLLFGLGAIFLATGLGLGLFISTISETQRQAMLSAIFVLAPSLVLSGFIFPIANMPKAIQILTYLIPARYFLIMVRGIFLKGIGLRYLWPEVLSLVVFGSSILALSILRFRKKIE